MIIPNLKSLDKKLFEIRIMLFFLLSVSILTQFIYPQNDREKIGIGEYRIIKSKILNEKRRVWINLPDSYHRTSRKYPVIYKCDAISVRLFGKRVNDLRSSSLKKKIPQHILVSIENTDRNRDMYPAQGKNKRIKPGADKFLKFIEKELIPFIESEYRADKFKILMGESNSAMFAIFAFLKKPELFSGYIASSPELDSCFDYFAKTSEATLRSDKIKGKYLYMIHGDRDVKRVIESVPKYEEILKKNAPKELKWKYEVLKNEGHVPASSMTKGLEFIYKGYAAPEAIIKQGVKKIKEYHSEFNKKMNHKFKFPNYSFFKYARILLRKKQKEAALKILSELLERNNEDAASFQVVLMAARLQRMSNNNEEAIKLYEYAAILSPPMGMFFKTKIKKLKSF